ncbi:MAG: deoxyribose-phosphate aldolase [Candidatus Izemoplasmatales bacterium]|jgi:deoxyribose-phosphate aldolase
MEINELIDHTYLKAFGTKKDIDILIDEAKKYHFKSVCIQPCFVKYAAEKLTNTGVLVCTVVGFPLGTNTTETKVFETLNAVANGADEIDMVINIGEMKSANYDYIKNEVESVVKAASGNTVKVIIETCYLTKDEIAKVSSIIGSTNAKFIKTSTGFGTSGATAEDVKIMKQNGNGLAVKAAGGVRTRTDLDTMVAAGASRIGTSNGVSLMQDGTGNEY